MRLCPIRVEKMVQCNEGSRGIVPQKKTVICGKKIQGFVRLTYEELCNPLETKYEDVFGMCPDHLVSMADPGVWAKGLERPAWHGGRAYFRDGVVAGLRGLVLRVEATEIPLDPREEKLLRQLEAHKANIKRIMGQSNAKGLTTEHWRVAFEEILQDMIVKDVMDA